MRYKKGQVININVKGDKRCATIVKDGVDSKGRVRIRPSGFPMEMSIREDEIVQEDLTTI